MLGQHFFGRYLSRGLLNSTLEPINITTEFNKFCSQGPSYYNGAYKPDYFCNEVSKV